MNGKFIKTIVRVGMIAFVIIQMSAFAAKTGKSNTQDANVRKKPTTSSDVVITLKKGAQVKVVETEGDWYKIDVNGKSGYIRSDKLDVSSESSAKSSLKVDTSNDNVGKTIITNTDDLNLRKEPSTDSEILKKIPERTKLKVRGVSDEWYQVSYDSETGFVRNDKVDFEAIAIEEKEEPIAELAEENIEQQPTADNNFDELFAQIPEDVPQENSEIDKTATSTGRTGLSTKQTQEMLTTLNFYQGTIDGNSGTKTQAAIKSFQRAYNIDIDGKMGEQTIVSLQDAIATGGNGTSAGKIKVKNKVYLAEWFNFMKGNFPKHTPIRCVDVETGEEFNLSAFSLGNHADVEPSTKKDTDILYRINGKKWTWTPRALWVFINNRWYAASINVMPHGGGVISGNGMNGQICMHFLHSRQHNTGRENNNLQKAVMVAFDNAKKAPTGGTNDDKQVGKDELKEQPEQEQLIEEEVDFENLFIPSDDDIVDTNDPNYNTVDES